MKMDEKTTKRFGFGRLAKGMLFDITLWVVGVAVLGMNVMLLQQNRSLRAAASVRAAPVAAPGLTIAEGKHLGRKMAAAALDYTLRPIDFSAKGSKRTLLITFSPVCPHCKANHKNWTVIANE